MMLSKIKYCGLLIFVSCTNAQTEIPTKTVEKKASSVKDCITKNDTSYNKTYVKYAVLDSTHYGVKVDINGKDTLLPYRFDCSLPQNLIPEVEAFYENGAILKRGHGEHFREFILCRLNKGNFEMKTYEISIMFDPFEKVIVYRDYDNLTNIIIEHIDNEKKEVLNISDSLSSESIIHADLNKNSLLLKFSNDVEVKVNRK